MLTVLGASGTNSTAVDQAKADALDAAIKAAFVSSGFNGCLDPSSNLVSVGIRDVKGANQPEFSGNGPASPGTVVGGQIVPKSAALVLTYKTLLAGKSYRGRSYLPGITEADNDGDGNFSTTCIANAIAFMTAVQGAMTASGFAHAVLSPALPERTINGELEPAKAAFATPVTSISSRSTTPGSQRRRSHRP
jgi:hypothetical protein